MRVPSRPLGAVIETPQRLQLLPLAELHLEDGDPTTGDDRAEQENDRGGDGVAPVGPERAFGLGAGHPALVEQARVDAVADHQDSRPRRA